MSNKKLLIINGPGLSDLSNYSVLGYDDLSLDILKQKCKVVCESLSLKVDFRQSDDESALLKSVMVDIDNFDAFIINPAGHLQSGSTSHDIFNSIISKISSENKPVIEVRIENIFKHEGIKPMQVSDSGAGFIGGLGIQSYMLAIKSINQKISN
jgi:3-dehydroquinate dehydratase II|tara:strand:+ start:460 stop:921 length:462 start_codon:yes stop_codon:yes gene_type:complete